MEGLELISFNIISHVGSAKSMVMESMQKSRQGEFKIAQQLIDEASELLQAGEKEHFQVIVQEAKEKNVEVTILFMHAEDQLMSTVTLRDIASEVLENYRMMYALKEQICKRE